MRCCSVVLIGTKVRIAENEPYLRFQVSLTRPWERFLNAAMLRGCLIRCAIKAESQTDVGEHTVYSGTHDPEIL